MSAFRDFLIGEWYFAWPLLLMSFTGLTLVSWRLLLNLDMRTVLPLFLDALEDTLHREGVAGGLRFCRARKDPIARLLFVPALEVAAQGRSAMRRALDSAMELEILPSLHALLPAILALAKIATMVGLLGTVISMINTFHKIHANPTGDMAHHASAIGLALFATAFGLVTAIPLVFAHVLFRAEIRRTEVRLRKASARFLDLVESKRMRTLDWPDWPAPQPLPPGLIEPLSTGAADAIPPVRVTPSPSA